MTYTIPQIPATASAPVSSAALLELSDAETSKKVSLQNLLAQQTIDQLTVTNFTVSSFASAYQIPAGTDVVEGLITSGLFAEGENWPLDLGTGILACGVVTVGSLIRFTPSGSHLNFNNAANTTTYGWLDTGTGNTVTLYQFAFSNVGGAPDVAIGRNAAGVIEVNNGSLGTYRDIQSRNHLQSGLTTNYNNIATAGLGQPAIYGSGNTEGAPGQTTSNSTYTVGAADGTFLIACNILVTTSSLHSFTAEVAYTSEEGTPRVLTLSYTLLAGGSLGTLVTNTNGTVPYEYIPVCIRAKAGTTITVRTNAAGTYTSVAYNMRSSIQQIA